MAPLDQGTQGLEQLEDVDGMEAGGRLVEEEEVCDGRPARRSEASDRPRNPASLSRCASPPERVEAGWPSLR